MISLANSRIQAFRSGALFALALLALLASSSASATKRDHGTTRAKDGFSGVHVDGDRVQLGQLDPTLPRSLLHLDVAPAPLPGRTMTISRDAVRSALRRAGADTSFADAFPLRQKIKRSSVTLETHVLRAELLDVLATRLPTGISVAKINGLHEVILPPGPHDLELRLGKLRRSNQATVIIRVAGLARNTLNITIFLKGQALAPVLRRNLPRKSVIAARDVDMVETKLESLPANAALRRNQLVGRALVQPHRAGRPLQTSQVRTPPLVERGREVTLTALASGIRVSQPSTCQEDGALGDWVRVTPISGGRPLRAKVVSSSEVQIELGGMR